MTPTPPKMGRPVTRPKGYVKVECLVPPEAAHGLALSAKRARGSRPVHLGRLLLLGLRTAESTDTLLR